jgi:uracil-DNA glycosylase
MPFAGAAGRRLFEWLARAGFSEGAFRAQQYLTSITRCYPGPAASGRGDRSPTREEQKLCRAHLDAELELLQPGLLILVGRHAIQALLGSMPLEQAVGSVHQDEQGRWLVPLPHRSGASGWLNDPAHRAQLERALRHLSRLRRRLAIPAG